jgi:hypothetical protein
MVSVEAAGAEAEMPKTTARISAIRFVMLKIKRAASFLLQR